MAKEKIQDFGAGQAAFLGRALAFNEARCKEVLSIEFADYIAQEIAVKTRLYNTRRNKPQVEEEVESSDEVDRDATDYYRTSRGE